MLIGRQCERPGWPGMPFVILTGAEAITVWLIYENKRLSMG